MSDFLLPPDLAEFRNPLREFLEAKFPLGTTRAQKEKGAKLDTSAWKEVTELGVFAAAIPEEHGGVGFGLRGAAIICEEVGRTLSPLPISETIIFGIATLLATADQEAAGEMLPKIATGELRFSGSWEPIFWGKNGGSVSLSGKVCSGTVDFAPFAGDADWLIAPLTEKSAALVSARDSALKLTSLETFELIRPYSTIQFSKAPCRVLPFDSRALPASAALLAAAELLGIARRSLEMITDYSKTRVQFDRPIGSFQAVQHQLSDCSLRIEQLEALIRFATWCADSSDSQFFSAAAAAKAFASEYLPVVLEKILQLHGGIGFTYEYDLHLFLRRAIVLSRLFGGAPYWHEQLAAHDLSSASQAA